MSDSIFGPNLLSEILRSKLPRKRTGKYGKGSNRDYSKCGRLTDAKEKKV